MIYVSDRSADSIWVTALLFLVMKSEYMPSHVEGSDSTSPVFCVACLYMVAVASVGRLSDLKQSGDKLMLVSNVVVMAWGDGVGATGAGA
jgi:Zn-finger protein